MSHDERRERKGRGERARGAGSESSSPDSESFDALGAAEELEATMAESAERGESGGSEAYIEMLEGEIAALQEELTAARSRAEKAEGKAESAAEEVDRSVERITREAAREQDRRLHATLRAFLEVLDDLDRAISSARQMDHNPEVVAGVELVRKRFLSVLAEYGVRPMATLGERFDPALHDAVSTLSVSDPQQDGAIVGVVSEGYAIGDEVLRPARVAVGRAG